MKEVLYQGEKIVGSALKVGMEVSVMTLFGRYTMRVNEFNPNTRVNEPDTATAYTKNGGMGAWLHVVDGIWESEACFDPKAIIKVLVCDTEPPKPMNPNIGFKKEY